MIRSFTIALIAAVAFAFACGCSSGRKKDADVAKVRLGVESFLARPPAVVKGKRVGLITNHTGTDSRGRSDIDLLSQSKSVKLVALFGPEHGIRGDADPGGHISHSTDARTGLPIYSLYQAGKGMDSRKPSTEMLDDVDVLVFDIQDVGARCYTYPYTMALGMQAAKEKGIPFVVLDRPNPIGGEMVESNLLDPKFATFVGLYPIPMRHGMTVGELARLFNQEFGIGADLTVIPARGWKRSQWWEATGLKWVAPSPNLPRVESTVHYPGTVAFEGTNLSCGRGTDRPFEQAGAPWLNASQVIEAMNALNLPGVRYEAVVFTPLKSGDKKFEGQQCHGVRLVCTDRSTYEPVRTNYFLVSTIRALHKDQFQFRIGHFDRLAGTDKVRLAIESGTLDDFLSTWEADEAKFRAMREPYLLYK